MRKRIIHIVNRAWQLVIATSETWDKIASEQPTEEKIRRMYVFPFIYVNVAVVFLCSLVYASENAWQAAFINTIVSAVALTGGYFIACTGCFRYLDRKYPQRYPKAMCTKVVSYCYTIVFMLRLVTEIIPSLFFLQILDIFTGYLVWEACRSVFNIPEEERSNIVLVFTLIIIFITPVLSHLMLFMLPNAAV